MRDDITRLIVITQNADTRAFTPLGVIAKKADGFHFRYVTDTGQVSKFDIIPGFADVDEHYHSEHLFDYFASRIVSRNRSDYPEYISKFGLAQDSADEWSLLAASGGQLKADTLEFSPLPTIQEGKLALKFRLSGIRHLLKRDTIADKITYKRYTVEQLESIISSLAVGQKLKLVWEQENPVSENATIAVTGTSIIGYVPEWIAAAVGAEALVDDGDLTVHRVGGREHSWSTRVEALLKLPKQYLDCFDKYAL